MESWEAGRDNGRRGRSDRISFSGDFSGDVRNNSLVGDESLVGEEASKGLTRSLHAWSRASRFYGQKTSRSAG